MNERRVSHLDVVTGLLIIWMIFFEHLRYMCGVQSFFCYVTLRKIFFLFMAWFYFKSGMFFNEHRTAIEVLKHDWSKVVVPYIIGCAIAVVVQFLYLIFAYQFELKPFLIRNIIDTLNHGGASWNIALWFLLSLYAVKIIFRWGATMFIH